MEKNENNAINSITINSDNIIDETIEVSELDTNLLDDKSQSY
jgi:hypothetical protein